MAINKKTLAAIEAVLYIACHQGDAPVSGKDICETHNLSSRYLEGILQSLVKGNVLKGYRGPKGGYILSKDRRHINLCNIYDCIINTKTTSDYQFSRRYNSILTKITDEINSNIRLQLSKITLANICEKLPPVKNGCKDGNINEFFI